LDTKKKGWAKRGGCALKLVKYKEVKDINGIIFRNLKYFQTIITLTKLQIVTFVSSSAKWFYMGHFQNS
jgi:hypothetical protein